MNAPARAFIEGGFVSAKRTGRPGAGSGPLSLAAMMLVLVRKRGL